MKILQPKNNNSAGGFTLPELLVGTIMSSIIIAPAFNLLIGFINDQLKEDAITKTEQELVRTADLIERDLRQSIFVYDSAGIAELTDDYSTTICPASGAANCSQLFADQNRSPVLVFWAREKVENAIPIGGNFSLSNCDDDYFDDAYTYSLITYFLYIDPQTDESRIERFKLRDGVRDFRTGLYVDEDGQCDSNFARDNGFSGFSTGSSLRTSLNSWEKAFGSTREQYDANNIEVLTRSVDATPTATATEDCTQIPASVGSYVQVPDYANNSGLNNKFKTYSFYACVNPDSNSTRVYLRGDAASQLTGNPNNLSSSYFPSIKFEVANTSRLD